jgi:membrane protein
VAKGRTSSADLWLQQLTEKRSGAFMPSDGTSSPLPHGHARYIWRYVSRCPLHSLWDFEGVPFRIIARNTWEALFADNLLGRSAELGFYFLFALFPTLFTACSILGLAARSAPRIYDNLLLYLAIVVPSSALGTVVETFNQTTAASSSGKLTFGLAAALWSASVGFSAIQDSLNVVYRVKEERPYWKARLAAIGITIVLSMLVTVILASLLGGDFFARLARHWIDNHYLGASVALLLRMVAWLLATILLSLFFAVIYYFGPDLKASRWHWLTPGSAIGILGWLLASLGLRSYVYFFDSYSASYGSLGAVIILLTWFYLSGLMLLLGGEINSEIEAAVKERQLAAGGQRNPQSFTALSLEPQPAPDSPGYADEPERQEEEPRPSDPPDNDKTEPDAEASNPSARDGG